MGVIRKIGKKWYVEFYYEGRRIKKPIGSKKDAQRALTAIEADILRGEFRFKKEKKINFSKFAEEYLEFKKANRMRSLRRFEVSVNNLSSFFKNMLLSKISYRDINEYKIRRIEKVKPATINRELACLKNMFTYAMKLEYVDENPVKKVEFFQETQYEMRILNRKEMGGLLNASQSHLRAIITLALGTGARRNEILKLRWNDIDFGRQYIFFKDTKNNIPRKVPMSGFVSDTLKSIEREGKYVFHNKSTGDRFKDIKKGFKSACDRAGIKDCRFHDLRHCAGTLMVEAGVDLPTVAEILGHSDIRTTMRYCHPTPKNKQRAVEALAGIVSGKSSDMVQIWYKKEKEIPVNPDISSN